MKKKILSIILSLAVAMTMMPAMAGVTFASEVNTAVPVELVKAATSGSRAVKLSWNKVSGATKYVVYGQKCGKSFKKLKTTANTSYKVKKIKGKKLKSHKAYKFYVVAYNGSKKIVSSKSIHFITAKTMGRYANARSINVNKTTLTLEPGKTAALKATTKIYKNKKHIKTSHGAKTRYISDNPSVASVNANGTVTAKAGGKATIYVQDIGGLWCKTVVTVNEPVVNYTVTFDLNEVEGVAPSEQTVSEGGKITKPEAPSDPSKMRTFTGWYTTKTPAEGDMAWDFDSDVVTSNITLYAKWDEQCIAAGTMISMADGSRKEVEEVAVGDSVRTFDHDNGELSTSQVAFIWESMNVTGAFTLTFENDIKVTVIEEHGFYDQDECRYVYINSQNVNEYIGHHFYNEDEPGGLKLQNCEIQSGSVDAYAIITKGDLNHMSNGMLSMCDGTVKVLANLFDYDDQMKFDAAKKNRDIETYGLMPKEKVLGLKGFTATDYDDYNMQYMNVAIGKGLISWEWLEALSNYCVENGL